jgi:hypothetical protein
VSRRVSLPGADELFRRTSEAAAKVEAEREERVRPTLAAAPPPQESAPAPSARHEADDTHGAEEAQRPKRTASGRVRHDEKMTVYITADELLELEHARLVLRRTLGSAVDRGRLVRAAVAMALADLDEHGADSELVRRLNDT